MFSCEFCQISWNTFLHRTPLVAASGINIPKHLILIGWSIWWEHWEHTRLRWIKNLILSSQSLMILFFKIRKIRSPISFTYKLTGNTYLSHFFILTKIKRLVIYSKTLPKIFIVTQWCMFQNFEHTLAEAATRDVL